MITINATKGELVNLINGLFAVRDLKGKNFSLVVSKNTIILQKLLQDLEDAGRPAPEFLEVAQKVNEIANKNEDNAKDQIDELEKENQELVDARREQMNKVEEMMKEEASVELHKLAEKSLPEEITAEQINRIIKIIEE